MSGRKPVAKRSAKKKDDAFIPSDNSDRDSQSDDPEIQKLLEKIEKINEAEEGAKPQKKRARKEPAKPASVQDPVPFPNASPAVKPARGRKKASPVPEEPSGPIVWQPAETALLTALITGIVPVVKLPTETRVTNQYKGILFRISSA